MRVKINTHGNPMPVNYGDWTDLYTAEAVEMKAGEFRIISLGVSMALPEGYEAHILPRSSTFKNWGVLMANGMGIVDNAYCGNDDIWGFPAVAMRDTSIPKGTRLCQFRLEKKCEPYYFDNVDDLSTPARGGFGSTGK